MTLKFYYDLMSQPCRAIYIFLKCSGIPFEPKVLALRKGEHKTEEYLKINPFGKVPSIVDDGFILTESIAIIKYIADKYNAPDFWYPRNLQMRAKVDEYCSWQHLNARWKSAKVFVNEVIMPGALGDTESLVTEMNGMLDDFEMMFVRDRKFILGDKISVADLLAACEIIQPTSSGRDVLKGRPVLQQWVESVRKETNPHFDEAHAFVYRLREKNLKTGKL